MKVLALVLVSVIAGLACKKSVQSNEAKPEERPPELSAVKAPAPSVTPTPAADDAGTTRRITIQVNEQGYQPSPVKLTKGEPVTLAVTRTTDKTCATEVIIKEHNINVPLPLNETVEVTFTPDKTGELKYGCAMGMMISGMFMVE